jgi:hypothetical protein
VTNTHIALAASTRAIIAYRTGKRDSTTHDFIARTFASA